jgi:hypothetical protein
MIGELSSIAAIATKTCLTIPLLWQLVEVRASFLRLGNTADLRGRRGISHTLSPASQGETVGVSRIRRNGTQFSFHP